SRSAGHATRFYAAIHTCCDPASSGGTAEVAEDRPEERGGSLGEQGCFPGPTSTFRKEWESPFPFLSLSIGGGTPVPSPFLSVFLRAVLCGLCVRAVSPAAVDPSQPSGTFVCGRASARYVRAASAAPASGPSTG